MTREAPSAACAEWQKSNATKAIVKDGVISADRLNMG